MNVIYIPGMPTCFNNPAEDMCAYAYDSNIFAQRAGKFK
jgi:hypothetical protein